MSDSYSQEQFDLVRSTVDRVVSGEITRDQAQKLLTDNGIPVLKKENWPMPAPV